MSTQTKLMLLFGSLALLAAIIAAQGINSAANFNQQLYDLRSLAQSLEKNSSARSDLLKAQVAVKNYLIAEDPNLRQAGEYYRFEQQFWNYLDERAYLLYDSDNAQIDQSLQTGWEEYLAKTDQIFSYDGQDWTIVADVSTAEADPAALEVENTLKNLSGQDVKDIDEQIQAIESSVQSSANLGRWMLILIAVLLVVGVYTTSRITRPLLSLNQAIVAFENNTYKPELLAPYTGGKDELGRLARSVDAMVNSITESNRIKENFITSASRFIPMQYLEFLEKPDITKVKLGDNVAAEMAVMFSDIRGFSTASEKMTPQENFDFVNTYLKLVSPTIQEHEGFIVKFLGDGMMAIFPYGVDDAVLAGIEKQEKVKEFNALLNQRGYPPVSVGIGIHTGQMMVGMIGEELRLQGDAFSDNVDLTSRVEGLNKFYGTAMIVSEETASQLKQPEKFKMRHLGKVVVKGRLTPLSLYEIYQGQTEDVVTRKDATKADFERGVQLFTAGDFMAAGSSFNKVLAQDPNDKTARFYLERCGQWLERGRPVNWDGVIVMDEK